MRVVGLRVRDVRSYHVAELALGRGMTVIHGANAAGKTNLLEALYLACTGRSCRGGRDREVVRDGEEFARVELDFEAEDGRHRLTVGIEPGRPKRCAVDDAAVERLVDVEARPLVSVFLPDRLDLVKGAPALRRAHLDQVVAALWPARAATRRAYGRALAQRNALLARRGGASLAAWERELARHGVQLMADRRETVSTLTEPFARVATELGLEGGPQISYRPRSHAPDVESLTAELADRRDRDLEAGFTGHGPHRDELALTHDRRNLRTYGSQGQQRVGLLALLIAEREVIGRWRSSPPLLLLDDVMSELDAERRRRLVDLLRDSGQTVITTTELGHVPDSDRDDVARVAVGDGAVLQDSRAGRRRAA